MYIFKQKRSSLTLSSLLSNIGIKPLCQVFWSQAESESMPANWIKPNILKF